MDQVQRRVAKERLTAEIEGVNTVIAEEGQVVPLAYAHLVPDSKSVPLGGDAEPTRSTSARRAAAESGRPDDAEGADKPKRSTGSKEKS